MTSPPSLAADPLGILSAGRYLFRTSLPDSRRAWWPRVALTEARPNRQAWTECDRCWCEGPRAAARGESVSLPPMNAPAAQAPPEEAVGPVDEVERRVPAPLADGGITHQRLEPGDQARIEPEVLCLAPATRGVPFSLAATPASQPDARLSRGEFVVLGPLPWARAVGTLVDADHAPCAGGPGHTSRTATPSSSRRPRSPRPSSRFRSGEAGGSRRQAPAGPRDPARRPAPAPSRTARILPVRARPSSDRAPRRATWGAQFNQIRRTTPRVSTSRVGPCRR